MVVAGLVQHGLCGGSAPHESLFVGRQSRQVIINGLSCHYYLLEEEAKEVLE